MKAILLHIGTIALVCVCIYMIAIGAQGRSSAPKQDVCIQRLNTPLSQNPNDYLKGVTVPDRVSLDFSHVNPSKEGSYDVIVHQTGDAYVFQIKVIK